MKLKAIRGLTYSTRRLQAGDEFEASDKDARLLIAIRKAKRMRDPAPVPPPPPAVADKIAAAVAPPTNPAEPEIETRAGTQAGPVVPGMTNTVLAPPTKPAPASRPLPATARVAPAKPPASKPGG